MEITAKPRSVALGSAIGAFMAVMPIMPIRTISILTCTTVMRANALAAVLTAFVIANPITLAPLYFIAILIGNIITPYSIDWDKFESTLVILRSGISFTSAIETVAAFGLEALLVLLSGGLLMAIPTSILVYFFSYKFFRNREINTPSV